MQKEIIATAPNSLSRQSLLIIKGTLVTVRYKYLLKVFSAVVPEPILN
jgi:hypothetical protein